MNTKTIRFVCCVCICCIVVLASCSSAKLSGTYENVDPHAQVTRLVFQGNRVTVTDCYIQVKCSYKLENNRLVIHGTSMLLGTEVAVNYDYDFEKKGNSIFLDGEEFVKQ